MKNWSEVRLPYDFLPILSVFIKPNLSALDEDVLQEQTIENK
jgi:hypothetical protein